MRKGFALRSTKKPWEDWRVVLHGSEAGDYLENPKDIAKVLKSLGYALIKVSGNKV